MRNGIDDKTAALEAELAEIQAQLAGAERDGAEIAALAEEAIRKLKGELAQLQNTSGAYCKDCQFLQRVLGGCTGVVVMFSWFHIWPWGTAATWQNRLGIALALAPLLNAEVQWRWLLFKRKCAWLSWKDNDIYRRISARWNGSLERARMR